MSTTILCAATSIPATCTEPLLAMLAYKRPHGSASEAEFIRRFLLPLGVEADGYGNLILDIGPAPTILWSSHTDSCHRTGGLQDVVIDGGVVRVADPVQSNCLGADDAAGVWIMTEMIKTRVPGRYVFHRGEERGGLGSSYIAAQTRQLLDGITAAIAFDRRGTGSIITHQRGGRSASDAFALSLAAAIGLDLMPDPTGTFTDTANYMDLVPECTNISVGYENEHSPHETLDLDHAERLMQAMVRFKADGLVIVRDPALDDWREWLDSNEPEDWHDSAPRRPRRSLYDLVYDHPLAVARFLEDCGVRPADLDDYIETEDV